MLVNRATNVFLPNRRRWVARRAGLEGQWRMQPAGRLGRGAARPRPVCLEWAQCIGGSRRYTVTHVVTLKHLRAGWPSTQTRHMGRAHADTSGSAATTPADAARASIVAVGLERSTLTDAARRAAPHATDLMARHAEPRRARRPRVVRGLADVPARQHLERLAQGVASTVAVARERLVEIVQRPSSSSSSSGGRRLVRRHVEIAGSRWWCASVWLLRRSRAAPQTCPYRAASCWTGALRKYSMSAAELQKLAPVHSSTRPNSRLRGPKWRPRARCAVR